jgi:hypothetical protein
MILASALSITAFAASSVLLVPPAKALDVTSAARRAADFAFDLFSGPTLQDETSTKPPSALDYTTGGGVP